MTESLATLLVDHPFADDEPLLRTIDTTTTAGEARTAARALASELRNLGVHPGQAVAVQLPNGPDLIVAMFGIWLASAVYVPVNPRAPEAERAHVFASTEPAALIDVDGIEKLDGARTYAPDTAFVLWTSGTTGLPKPILHTHSAYFELIDRVLGALRDKPRDPGKRPVPNLVPVSLALNAGIYNTLFGLRAGAAVVVMDRFDPEVFAALVARFGITSTVLPPAAMVMLTESESVTSLAPLRYVRSITAPLAPLHARRFVRKFGDIAILNSYGQAEIGEVIGWTAADAREHPEKVGAAGRPHRGVDVKLVDDRLFVRPPRMAAGYASGEELSDRVDAEGYVDTGDLARIDDEGFVWIEGRAGDLINRGGNKVVPGQVEEVLASVPGVHDAAVVGRPDDRLGEVPVAFVIADESVTDDELEAACRDQLVAYKVPAAFHRVAELPRNEVGKVLRKELLLRKDTPR